MHTGNHNRHGRHPPVSCRGLYCLPALHGAYLASMSVPVGIGLHRWPLTQAFRGVELTRVPIRHGDHSASGIAPLAIRDGMTGALAIRVLRRSPSLGSMSCRRRRFTRVPREANARRPRGSCDIKQGCPTYAEVRGRTISASKSREVGAPATGVDRLVAPARRKRSQQAPSRGRLFELALPTGDSYWVTSTAKPHGHRLSGDLTGLPITTRCFDDSYGYS